MDLLNFIGFNSSALIITPFTKDMSLYQTAITS